MNKLNAITINHKDIKNIQCLKFSKKYHIFPEKYISMGDLNINSSLFNEWNRKGKITIIIEECSDLINKEDDVFEINLEEEKQCYVNKLKKYLENQLILIEKQLKKVFVKNKEDLINIKKIIEDKSLNLIKNFNNVLDFKDSNQDIKKNIDGFVIPFGLEEILTTREVMIHMYNSIGEIDKIKGYIEPITMGIVSRKVTVNDHESMIGLKINMIVKMENRKNIFCHYNLSGDSYILMLPENTVLEFVK